MAEETQTTQTEVTTPDWECNFCGQKEGVENGVCPKCGPSQTTPLSKAAKEEAGVVEEEPETPEEEAEKPSASESK